MVQIEDMSAKEMQVLLERLTLGHLGCAREGRPYVLPMHYVYDSGSIYFLTTEGMKTEYIEKNPEVCFQIEEIISYSQWQSVIVIGRAERLTRPEDTEHAMQLITRRNPTLTPAINATRIDVWGRSNTIALYRIKPDLMDGRKTTGEDSTHSEALQSD